jgi:DNA-binding LacI/PurR family transcriptional regulator
MAEFARYVGLSRSAVSRVLNGQTGLRQATIDRVHEAMKETGFTVNAHALHLRGKPSSTIGVCMENLLTPTAVSKLSILQDLLRLKDYVTVIEVIKPAASHRAVQHLHSLRVDGIIFIGHFEKSELEQRLLELKRQGTPHLVVDHPGIPSANTVTLDRVKAMVEVTDHLLSLGHRRFGLLGVSGPFQTVTDRLEGIERALAKHGLAIAQATQSLDYLHPLTDHFTQGRLLAESFSKLPRPPTAYIAVNDETAIGAMQEFQAHGWQVPKDISIVGFNNQSICLMARPWLTSVDQQIEKSMAAAVDALLQQVEGRLFKRGLQRKIAPLFVERASTGPCRKGG